MAVEWPERWPRAPVDAIAVAIEPDGDTTRRITASIDLAPESAA
jgi:hypothetical protein